MNRPRKKDRHLPPCVFFRHGAYHYTKRGKSKRLGATLTEALAEYALLFDAPRGSMPELIWQALQGILPRVKPNTARQYRIAGAKLSKAFYEFTPRQVLPRHVAQFKADMKAKPNMANRCLSVLRQVFDYALEQQLIDSNPALGIKRHIEAKRTRLVSAEEFALIYAKAGPRLQVIMDLCRLTGQRIGDVLAIRRADLTEAGIRFQQQKTGERLTVKWTPELEAVVTRARKLNQNIVALTLLHNRRGKRPDYRTVRDQWDRACELAGVEDAHLHDLRAVSATKAKNEGKNPTALLGHTNPAQTERYLRQREETLVEGPSFGQLPNSTKK